LILQVLVGIYPDGTSFRARRVVTSPSPTHPPARTHSPTLTLASSASSIRPPLSPSTHSYPPRLTSTLCRPTAHVSSPDYALPIQLDSLVGAGLSACVYSFTLDGIPCVAKIARRGLDAAYAVEREILWSTRPELAVLARDDDLVLVEAVYEREGDGRPVLLMRDGGPALERWEELERDQGCVTSRLPSTSTLARAGRRADSSLATPPSFF